MASSPPPFLWLKKPGEDFVLLYRGKDELPDVEAPEGARIAIHPFQCTDRYGPLSFSAPYPEKIPIPALAEMIAARPLPWMEYVRPADTPAATREEHIQLVKNLQKEMASGGLLKAIASRAKKIEMPAHFHPAHFFKAMCERYEDAYVYLLAHQEAGIWAGSSPELLLKQEGELIETLSLAGTLPNDEGASFGPKELEEQQIVTDSILQTLAACGVITEKPGPPQVKKLRHISHLYTRLFGKTIGGAMNATRLAAALHPTPAVGGFPKEKALQVINQYENYDRAYYAGYIGITGPERSLFFVNLRCMQLAPPHILLYAGGGITALSQPEKEWEETEWKMQTLEHLINRLYPP